MYETQIQAGMAFMDEHDVPEWKSLINLDKLSLASQDACILGQRFELKAAGACGYFSGFQWAQAYFELSEETLIRLGFDIGQTGHYGYLTSEWIEALKPFRKAAA